MNRVLAAFAAGFLVLFLIVGAARAASATNVEGWIISRVEPPNACEAAGPVSDNVQLVIAIIGPQTKLLFSSPDFHMTAGTYPVAISIDGGPKVALNALGEYGVYAIAMVHDLGVALRTASTLTAQVGGKSYDFTFRHADAAMDAASQCAGEPTFLEPFAQPPKAIQDASDWKLIDNLQGVDRCSLRRGGQQVDTMLSRNRDGQFILYAGRADWAFPTGKAKVSLQFDSAPPDELEAGVFDNLVIVSLRDAATEQKLLHASQLRWHLPWGDFQAKLDGLPVALDALAACDLKKASGRVD
jgi:hypothetical protein